MLVGEKLGRYEIRARIGAGGMGEVFLAHDPELERAVALKVLLPEFCCNEERVQRFKLEAKAASALNHPNIITIHEIGQAGERLYIATEFVDGETLREKIEKNELSLLEAVKIAEQTADALAVAHAAHIVHRDIKPENVMIRRDGYVKILDFGLVKPTVQPASGGEDATQQLIKTQPGLVMGSVRYMSPEQARGKDLDERTDVWSLGVVLYEMLAGANPFDGETVSDSLAALIHIEPPPLENVPAELERIIRKTLRKTAADRYQNIKSFALDLKDLRLRIEHDSAENEIYSEAPARTAGFVRQDTSENKTLIHRTLTGDNETDAQKTDVNKTQVYATANRANWNFLPLVILGLAGMLALGGWYYQPFTRVKAPPKFESVQISRLTENGKSGAPAISPDGKNIAYVSSENGMRALLVRQTATGGSVQIVPPTNLGFYAPVFSRDGSHIYYTTVDKGIGTLYRVPTLGGAAKKIAVDVDSKVTFAADGSRLAFIRHDAEKGGDTILTANSDGTNLQPLISTKDLNYSKFSDAAWMPGEEKLLVGAVDRAYKEDLLSTSFILVSLADKRVENFGEKKWLNAASFGWQKDRAGVYFVGKSGEEDPAQIWFLSYPEAEARAVTNDSSGYAMMSYAPESDTIITAKKDVISSLWSYNPQSKELSQVTGESRNLHGAGGLARMPDGRLVFTKTEGNKVNLYRMDADGKNETPLTDEDGYHLHPTAAPDGRFIVFASNRTGSFRLWRMDADGKNPVQLTGGSEGMDLRPQILKDGKTIVFERTFEDKNKSTLLKISLDGGREETLFPESRTNDVFPSVSGDGKTLAYTSQSFDPKALEFKHLVKLSSVAADRIAAPSKEISLNLGWNYRWTANNRALTYLNTQGVPNLFNLPLDGSPPKQITNFNSGIIMNFDWSLDGRKLYVVRGVVSSDLILIKDSTKI